MDGATEVSKGSVTLMPETQPLNLENPSPHVKHTRDDDVHLEQLQNKLKRLKETHAEQERDAGHARNHHLESKFAGKPLSSLVILEIFAGSARLPKACNGAGMTSIAVDKTTERSQGVHILLCDLTDEMQYETLVTTLELQREHLVWGHFAPACGTASRAREKPAPHLESKGISVPKPCRSEEYPYGLPGLTGTNKIRTEAANLVYRATCRLIRVLVTWQVVCSLENLENSLFWLIPCVADMLADLGGFDSIFDSCLHGGHRKKSARWWCTADWFLSLAGKCANDGSHLGNQLWWATELCIPLPRRLLIHCCSAHDLQALCESACCLQVQSTCWTSNSKNMRICCQITGWFCLQCQEARNINR